MKASWQSCLRSVVALGLVGFLGCAKPSVIHGRVVDVFSKPVAGAEVSIPKTTFKAISGADGRYTIEYVPGQFELLLKKPTYASATISLNVTQASELPAVDAVLFPIPPEPGIYYIGRDRLVPLPERRIQSTVKSQLHEYAFPFSNDPTPSIAFGTEARFLDTLPAAATLYRGDPEFYQVQYLTGLFETPMSPSLNNEVTARTTELGDEKLRLRTVKLEQSAVYYGWLSGPVEQAKSAYVFSVPSPVPAD
jgi:hypothetical protein